MFNFLENFAQFATAKMGLSLGTRLGDAVSFFIEDFFKIFLLIYITLFVVSLFRYQLAPEKIRQYLSGKSSLWGYVLAVILGAVTPFCSCSSIPLFLGFVAAGLPFGITMAFLISSPLISEVAVFLLLITPHAGWKVALVYVVVGALIGILGGWLCDKFHLEKYLKEIEAPEHNGGCCCSKKEKIKSTVIYANNYALTTIKEIGLYVIVGLLLGAFMHGYIPQEFFVKYLGAKNIFAVPMAAIVGIPIYANHNSVLPIVQVLLMKGVPVGTTLVMLMSITAISLPELIMLNKVLKWKILAIFVGFLLISFIAVGYLLNAIM
jgi:uncharacterized protein